jgi:hypothetical protein
MAGKNRRRRNDSGSAILKPVIACLVIAGVLGLAYLRLHSRCESLGREIQGLEAAKVDLAKKYRNEEYRWAQVKSPRNLERALAERHIAMDWPSVSQVVHLGDYVAFAELQDRSSTDKDRYAKLDRPARNE